MLKAEGIARGDAQGRFRPDHYITTGELALFLGRLLRLDAEPTLGATKPDPRFFTEAASRVGVAPNECVMVGNDYVKDIIGAKQAGMHTVWLAAEVPGSPD